MIEKRRFGRTMKLPSTVSIKRQILLLMLDDAQARERVEAGVVKPFPATAEPAPRPA